MPYYEVHIAIQVEGEDREVAVAKVRENILRNQDFDTIDIYEVRELEEE